jgi:hypothetical protein
MCFRSWSALDGCSRRQRPKSTWPSQVRQEHCFGNINSPEIDAVLQPQFGTVRLVTGFNTHHIDHNQVLFDIGRRIRAA